MKKLSEKHCDALDDLSRLQASQTAQPESAPGYVEERVMALMRRMVYHGHSSVVVERAIYGCHHRHLFVLR